MRYPVSIIVIEDENDRVFMKRLYEKYNRLMYFVAKRYSVSEAEDIINESSIALINKIPFLRTLESFLLRAYIVNTTRNIAINISKKSSREANRSVYIEDAEFISDAPEIDENLMRLSTIEEIKIALKKLPTQYFDILEMRYFQDLSDKEISDILGITPDSVRVYLSRARKMARKLLMEQGGAQYGA